MGGSQGDVVDWLVCEWHKITLHAHKHTHTHWNERGLGLRRIQPSFLSMDWFSLIPRLSPKTERRGERLGTRLGLIQPQTNTFCFKFCLTAVEKFISTSCKTKFDQKKLGFGASFDHDDWYNYLSSVIYKTLRGIPGDPIWSLYVTPNFLPQ